MNPLLILIFIPMVIAIGYILSRPFENLSKYQPIPPSKDDLKFRYESLLQEIKKLQHKPHVKLDPTEVNKLIAEKKQEAAELLRKLNPNLENNSHP